MLLFYSGQWLKVERITPEILSLGDSNSIRMIITNHFFLRVKASIIDELPFQFQLRNFKLNAVLEPKETRNLSYQLTPTSRGEHDFNFINVFVHFPFCFIERRFRIEAKSLLKVYPSLVQMRLFQLKVITRINRLEGAKKFRKLGQSYEFDQIRNYVEGDDFRHINWKATSRAAGALKINQFEDEKAQAVYTIIDKSRNMKMPFNGLSLMDYAINSGLVLANTALLKGDKAGLISFAERIETGIKAENKSGQIGKILQSLYNQKQSLLEANYELLYHFINRSVKQRSLLFLYTNFETTHNLERILPILKKINHRHVLVLVLFQNSEIIELSRHVPKSIEELYNQVIAERFIFQKAWIAKVLNSQGIKSILTRPEDLTLATVNKYLEIKSLGLV